VFSSGVLISGGLVHLGSDAINLLVHWSGCANPIRALEEPARECSAGWIQINTSQVNETFWVCSGVCMDFPLTYMLTGIAIILVAIVELFSSHEKKEEKDDFIPLNSDFTVSRSSKPKMDCCSSLVFLIVLSFPSFFEGLGLGIDTLESQDMGLGIFIAIMSNQGFEAFALGTNFAKDVERGSIPKPLAIVILVIWSTFTPIGAFLGVLITGAFSGKDLLFVQGLVLAFAAGTFMYVGIVEMLVEDFFEQRTTGHKKNICVIFTHGFAAMSGFVLMTLLAYWLE